MPSQGEFAELVDEDDEEGQPLNEGGFDEGDEEGRYDDAEEGGDPMH